MYQLISSEPPGRHHRTTKLRIEADMLIFDFDDERDAITAILRKYGVTEEAIKDFFEPYPN
ncbi:hypothetical protein [Microbacterium sp. SORGH_AS_0888]|uniref:hypothetical protein n=1 Tax=Microbacterium sp. SORGH_AS_0888 TaxID=3041791 RepID=UPI00277F5F88|nr:hypothetical protein [Microbacterium sp. SORGH_AS_0888]MDQ1130402.1 hypothetical protein [Microbacterium sp. SORGH_AS_0888]